MKTIQGIISPKLLREAGATGGFYCEFMKHDGCVSSGLSPHRNALERSGTFRKVGEADVKRSETRI
ncbi:MAG TPA: hypothetical protein VME24_13360 [Alphaproteobacteria bacterium]|nr:hypothetical protein [Alphaproteobacteria bacterium]